jgi:branched-chain amino acid transport system ATP-binding protein
VSLLTVDHVTRSFGGNRAVDDVSFEMFENTLAVVGPNGAGKTTLLNLLAGQLHPNRGTIHFQNRNITRFPPWRIARMGMVKTYQIVRPFRSLTVEENLVLFSQVRGTVDRDEILAETGLTEWRNYPTGVLPFGLLKRLELAKGLATRPDLLLLDEPIGGLSRAEAQALVATLTALKGRGVRMLIVEHRLSEILPVVDRVLALDRGRIIFHGSRSEFYHDPAVRTAYLGSSDAGS